MRCSADLMPCGSRRRPPVCRAPSQSGGQGHGAVTDLTASRTPGPTAGPARASEEPTGVPLPEFGPREPGKGRRG